MSALSRVYARLVDRDDALMMAPHPTQKGRRTGHAMDRIARMDKSIRKANCKEIKMDEAADTVLHAEKRSTADAPLMNKTANTRKQQQPEEDLHFVFGYGSLMCPRSRAITAPDIDPSNAQPVVVQDVERVWSVRVEVAGMTAMGVRFRKGAHCTGVLLPVTKEQLQKFDVRELGYTRVKVELDNVEQVPFLPDHLRNDEHVVFAAKKEQGWNERVFVWIYVQEDSISLEANGTFPIAQSYVDVILRGCFSISDEFAHSFMRTTHGWDSDHPDGILVNDRHDPLYIRADSEFSQEKGELVDELLSRHYPEAMDKRRKYGRTQSGREEEEEEEG